MTEHHYKDLNPGEDLLIAVYFDTGSKEGWPDKADMSNTFFEFAINLPKRNARKKPSTVMRDMDIYCRINDLLAKGHNLTSNSQLDGAADIVASELKGVSKETAIRAYNRFKKEWDARMRRVFDELNSEPMTPIILPIVMHDDDAVYIRQTSIMPPIILPAE